MLVAALGGEEAVLDHHRRMAAGFALGTPGHLPFGPHLASFGHTGAGAFANPTARLGFTYVMNSFHAGPAPNPRMARLVEAVYQGLEAA